MALFRAENDLHNSKLVRNFAPVMTDEGKRIQ
jgi:hypothetical protein